MLVKEGGSLEQKTRRFATGKVDEARDNVEFGTSDEWAALASPDGVDVVKQDLWNEVLAGYATDRKIELAKELERLAKAVDPRVRVGILEALELVRAAVVAGVGVDGDHLHIRLGGRILERRARDAPEGIVRHQGDEALLSLLRCVGDDPLYVRARLEAEQVHTVADRKSVV